MTWIIVAISVCVLGFMVGVCRACCTACHGLCTPETTPTGSITVTLPALTDVAGIFTCNGTCANFGDTFILDKLTDPFIFGSTGCSPQSFIDACYWGLDISPLICPDLAGRETLLLSLSGGGVNDFEIRLNLCFDVSFVATITWLETVVESLPFDCDTLGTRTITFLSSTGVVCETTDDASVTF
jgi:hypothetical protein